MIRQGFGWAGSVGGCNTWMIWGCCDGGQWRGAGWGWGA
jgi:hypothetical protein